MTRLLASVPWVRRVQARHLLQELHSRALELRQGLAHADLNADGAVADVDAMIASLQTVRRLLEGGSHGADRDGPAGQ